MYKFEELTVWKESIILTRDVYVLCQRLPFSEERNLIDQIKRATVSVCLNIAEGTGADNDKDFKRFLLIAKKSAFEVMAILRIVDSLYKIRNLQLESKVTLVIKLLNGLIKYLKSEISVDSRP